jgi:hypothetical protein
MNKKWSILLAAALVLVVCQWVGAGDSGEQAQEAFRSSLAKGSVGRFQAVAMDDSSVVILDTQEGHVWMWDLSGLGTVSMVYGGQVFLGENMGEMVQSVPLKSRKK